PGIRPGVRLLVRRGHRLRLCLRHHRQPRVRLPPRRLSGQPAEEDVDAYAEGHPMFGPTWQKLLERVFRIGRRAPRGILPRQPRLEALEERWLPSINLTGQNFSATEGLTFTGSVATFTDSDGNSSPAAYTATIDWGDGTTAGGTVAARAGGFGVDGKH